GMLTRQTKTISAHEAAALVRSGDWLDYGAVLPQPEASDRALSERVADLRDVNIRACLSVRPRAVLEADPTREHFHFFNWHLRGYDRKQCDAGRQNYIPYSLDELQNHCRRFIYPPEIRDVKARPACADGFFNF